MTGLRRDSSASRRLGCPHPERDALPPTHNHDRSCERPRPTPPTLSLNPACRSRHPPATMRRLAGRRNRPAAQEAWDEWAEGDVPVRRRTRHVRPLTPDREPCDRHGPSHQAVEAACRRFYPTRPRLLKLHCLQSAPCHYADEMRAIFRRAVNVRHHLRLVGFHAFQPFGGEVRSELRLGIRPAEDAIRP